MHMAEWKKPVWKGHVLYDSIHVHWKRQNHRNSKEIHDCQEFGEDRGSNRQNTGDFFFKESETLLYDAVMVDTWHNARIKPTECHGMQNAPEFVYIFKKSLRSLENLRMERRWWQKNLIALQMYEITEGGVDLCNSGNEGRRVWRWEAKGTVHKYWTQADKTFPMGNGLAIVKPL